MKIQRNLFFFFKNPHGRRSGQVCAILDEWLNDRRAPGCAFRLDLLLQTVAVVDVARARRDVLLVQRLKVAAKIESWELYSFNKEFSKFDSQLNPQKIVRRIERGKEQSLFLLKWCAILSARSSFEKSADSKFAILKIPPFLCISTKNCWNASRTFLSCLLILLS